MEFPPLPSELLDLTGCTEKVDALYGRGHQRTVITEKGADACRMMRADGMPLSVIAWKLGIPTSTLKDCIKRQPELKEAMAVGQQQDEYEHILNLRRAAKAGNPIPSIFLLKAMHGYRENDAPTVNVSNISLQLPQSLTDEDLARLAAKNLTVYDLPEPKQEDDDELEGEVVDE